MEPWAHFLSLLTPEHYRVFDRLAPKNKPLIY